MSMLKNIKLVLTLSCRDASRLLSDRSARRLALHERLALRMHLLICRGCRRFRNYLQMLDLALRPTDAPDDAHAGAAELMASVEGDEQLTDEARQRLKHRLRQM